MDLPLGSRFRRAPGRSGHPLGRSLALLALVLGVTVLVGACSGDRSCYDEYCDCHGRRECILGCARDGCDLACSHTSESCGAICEDGCSFECHDTNHCSALCDDDCRYLCHHAPSCAGECGARCDYECHDVSECAVRVGPRSKITCRSVAHCKVDCDGPCDVTCRNVDRCDVSCAPGLTRRSTAGGYVCE